jgi:uncharacterized protein YbjT (DUF2867 family)
MTQTILVTGATGYIASRLIPELLARGYKVRALARRPHLLRARAWFHQIEIFPGDVMDSDSLAPALDGVDVAYYLIHNMTAGHGYTEIELEGARHFAEAAEKANLRHIIYLGGLADPEQHIAPHMRSRIETGVTLRQGKVPVTEFRAGVIAGSGSISFEMIRFMTELFPIIPGPGKLNISKSQPIATENVVDYLLAALENSNGRGKVFEIGGPDVFTYQQLMKKYAEARGLKRGFLLLPYVPIWFMAFGIDLMTPVPYPIAYALVGGLSGDSVILHHAAEKAFPEVKLIDFDSATSGALKRLHPDRIERVWASASGAKVKILKHEGFFIDHRRLQVNVSAEKVFAVISNMGRGHAWPYANWLWKLRGLFGIRKFEPVDGYDYYSIDGVEENQRLLLRSQLKAPGEGWMEWRVSSSANGTLLEQTAYFTPNGLGGFLYWWLLFPFHALVFHGLILKIAQKSLA